VTDRQTTVTTGFYIHLTQNRSFRRRSPTQPLGLVWKNQTKHNKSTHTAIKRNVLQHKINTKKNYRQV